MGSRLAIAARDGDAALADAASARARVHELETSAVSEQRARENDARSEREAWRASSEAISADLVAARRLAEAEARAHADEKQRAEKLRAELACAHAELANRPREGAAAIAEASCRGPRHLAQAGQRRDDGQPALEDVPFKTEKGVLPGLRKGIETAIRNGNKPGESRKQRRVLELGRSVTVEFRAHSLWVQNALNTFQHHPNTLQTR